MSFRVVFSPEAEDQLAALFSYVAAAASPDIAARYTEALLIYCESLRTQPSNPGAVRSFCNLGLLLTGRSNAA